MGIRYLLAKAELAKHVRERKRQEAFGNQKPDLFRRLVPRQATVRFRCQIEPEAAGKLKIGDMLLLYAVSGGVSVCHQNKKVAHFIPSAAADFAANFAAEDSTDVRIAEVISEPSPLDDTMDITLRPPWPTDEPKNP